MPTPARSYVELEEGTSEEIECDPGLLIHILFAAWGDYDNGDDFFKASDDDDTLDSVMPSLSPTSSDFFSRSGADGSQSGHGGRRGLGAMASPRTQASKSRTGSASSDTECGVEQVEPVLSYFCEAKSNCTLYASNDLYTDPCPGENKYLYVSYYCTGDAVDDDQGFTLPSSAPTAPHPTSPPSAASVVIKADEGGESKLDCGDDEIHVDYAGWGVRNHGDDDDDANTAIAAGDDGTETAASERGNAPSTGAATGGVTDPGDGRARALTASADSCGLSDVTTEVSKLCESKHYCTIGLSTDTFGDPCYGISKSFFLAYSCN